MSRFYVSPESVKGEKIYVGKEESHHIVDVMRLRSGDQVTVFDGTGRIYEGAISSAEGKGVTIDILKTKTAAGRRTASIALAQAVPKKDKMDLIIQKATELGVDKILPFESARTVVKSQGERSRRKMERWQKIAVEASKQCGRAELPKVGEVAGFETILELLPGYDLVVMPCLSGEAAPFKTALKDIGKPKKALAVIGPEGGFTEGEIEKAGSKGAVLVSLGGLVLRSDTAAITTLSILNYILQ
jgi:16S rRNA (uracil1498-N3)-methyltransferase